MSFHNVRFPLGIALGAVGGPEFSTGVVEMTSGHERRNVNWSQARCRYNVAYGVKDIADIQALIAFHRARRGAAYGFRFFDWSDYQAAGQVCTLLTSTTYQLYRHYTDSGATHSRKITRPIHGETLGLGPLGTLTASVRVYKDGVLQSSGWSVNTSTGVITFSVAPGSAVVTADFAFDVPVRFASDYLPARLELATLGACESIELVEVRE